MPSALSKLLAAIAACIVASAASAQPSLKMMIPANPGGGWDQTGRALAATAACGPRIRPLQSVMDNGEVLRPAAGEVTERVGLGGSHRVPVAEAHHAVGRRRCLEAG